MRFTGLISPEQSVRLDIISEDIAGLSDFYERFLHSWKVNQNTVLIVELESELPIPNGDPVLLKLETAEYIGIEASVEPHRNLLRLITSTKIQQDYELLHTQWRIQSSESRFSLSARISPKKRLSLDVRCEDATRLSEFYYKLIQPWNMNNGAAVIVKLPSPDLPTDGAAIDLNTTEYISVETRLRSTPIRNKPKH